MLLRFRLLAALLLALLPSLATTQPERIVVLVDASYSMALAAPPDGRSAVATAAKTALAYLTTVPESTPIAVITTEHEGHTYLDLPFTHDRAAVGAALSSISAWGTTALGEAIAAAVTYLQTAGETGELLILTDGLDTQALLGTGSYDLESLVPPQVRLSLIRAPAPSGVGIGQELASLASLRGGFVHTLGSGAALSYADDRDSHGEPASQDRSRPDHQPHTADLSPPAASAPAVSRSERGNPLAILYYAGLALSALAAIVTGALFAQRELRWRARARAVREHNATPPVVRLLIVSAGGGSARVDIDRFPATVGTASSADVVVDLRRHSEFALHADLIDDRLQLQSASPLRLGGREVDEAVLSVGMSVRSGTATVYFDALQTVRRRKVAKRIHTPFLAPAGAFAVIAATLLSISPPRAVATNDTPVSVSPTGTTAADTPPIIEPIPGHEQPESVLRELEQEDPAPQRRLLTSGLIRKPPAGSTSRLLIIGPEDPLPRTTVDYLVVHAHPDDESLDFGAFMANATERGLTGAVLLLTDGSSGLDQFPYRSVTATLPERDLAEEELATVRIGEAAQAIEAAGASIYIRWGLSNSPYGSLTDEQSVFEVFDRWGGGAQLVDRLASVIRELRPSIILSPDGPRDAREHFEHEACGVLVWKAIEAVEPQLAPTVHLLAVDPLQRRSYSNRLVYYVSSPAVRGRQLRALALHQTQRDSATIGIEVRLSLSAEYYAVARWPESAPMELGILLDPESEAAAGPVRAIRMPPPVGKFLGPLKMPAGSDGESEIKARSAAEERISEPKAAK